MEVKEPVVAFAAGAVVGGLVVWIVMHRNKETLLPSGDANSPIKIVGGAIK